MLAAEYVLRLTDRDGDASAARTLDDYVVTPALAEAFDDAMGVVAESITSGVSRGAFLTDSFGSGQSHFMAVLRHDPVARASTELQPSSPATTTSCSTARSSRWPSTCSAPSRGQAVFAGYPQQIGHCTRGASLPAIHQFDGVLVDAERMRRQIGDDQFLAGLNGDAQDGTDGCRRTGGERRYGRRYFLEMLSVFTADPQFTVMHGRDDVGAVDLPGAERR